MILNSPLPHAASLKKSCNAKRCRLWAGVMSPTNEGVLGEIALSSLPRIEQIFVNAPAGWRPRDMERRLFIARRRIEKASRSRQRLLRL